MNRGNYVKARTPAQRAHMDTLKVGIWRKGRPPKKQVEPFGRAQSGGLFGFPIKTVDAELRAMIDAAMQGRAV